MNGISATIERIGQRYTDTKGQVWAMGGSEWRYKTIDIPARESGTYSGFVRTRVDSDLDLRGGTVRVSYSGVDAKGNEFSGSVSATLACSP